MCGTYLSSSTAVLSFRWFSLQYLLQECSSNCSVCVKALNVSSDVRTHDVSDKIAHDTVTHTNTNNTNLFSNKNTNTSIEIPQIIEETNTTQERKKQSDVQIVGPPLQFIPREFARWPKGMAGDFQFVTVCSLDTTHNKLHKTPHHTLHFTFCFLQAANVSMISSNARGTLFDS